jgi:hypothetical protein
MIDYHLAILLMVSQKPVMFQDTINISTILYPIWRERIK